MTATTFASLTHGTSFRFADTTLAYAGTTLTDPTTYTKTGAFTFATGGTMSRPSRYTRSRPASSSEKALPLTGQQSSCGWENRRTVSGPQAGSNCQLGYTGLVPGPDYTEEKARAAWINRRAAEMLEGRPPPPTPLAAECDWLAAFFVAACEYDRVSSLSSAASADSPS